jgi:hypothetical protein
MFCYIFCTAFVLLKKRLKTYSCPYNKLKCSKIYSSGVEIKRRDL